MTMKHVALALALHIVLSFSIHVQYSKAKGFEFRIQRDASNVPEVVSRLLATPYQAEVPPARPSAPNRQ